MSQLIEAERITRRFLEWLWEQGNIRASFTATEAIVWARGTGSFKNSYEYQRLSAVRSFAHYCLALGLDVQVPAISALNPSKNRRVPHIYNPTEIDALIAACQNVFFPALVQDTMATIIALLAVSGMRVGEALRLRPQEIQSSDATALIRANKHGSDRLIPLHPTTVNALATYESSPYQLDWKIFATQHENEFHGQSSHWQRVRILASYSESKLIPSPCIRMQIILLRLFSRLVSIMSN